MDTEIKMRIKDVTETILYGYDNANSAGDIWKTENRIADRYSFIREKFSFSNKNID